MELIQTVAVPGLAGLDWKTATLVEKPDIFHDYDEALAWVPAQ